MVDTVPPEMGRRPPTGEARGRQAADPVADWRTVRDELAGYSEALAARPTLLLATKVEDEESAAKAEELLA